MAGIAGVQGGNINALETTLTSLQHRGSHRTWASRTEYAATGCCRLKTESTPQHKLSSQAYGKSVLPDIHPPNATSTSLTDTTLPLSRYQKSGSQLTHPSLPQIVAVWDPFTAGFWDI